MKKLRAWKIFRLKALSSQTLAKILDKKMWKLNHCSTVIKVLKKSNNLVLFEIGMKNFQPWVCKLRKKKTLTVAQHWSKSSRSRIAWTYLKLAWKISSLEFVNSGRKKTLTVAQHWSKSSQSRSPLANGCFQVWTNNQINNKQEQGRTNTRYICRNIELFLYVE